MSPPTLARLPLTRREDMVRDQLAHLPLGSHRFVDAPPPVRVGVAGTGAGLLVLAWSPAALARERAAGVRLFRRLGLAPGMCVANTLPGALATPGSLLLGDVVQELGGLDLPLGAIDDQAAALQAWELLERVQPEVLIVDPASAGPLLAVAPPADLRRWWRGVVWLRRGATETSERAPDDFVGWKRTWLAVPEATSFVAGSCAAGHFHMDEAAVAEVVDGETGTGAPAGEQGLLALAPLGGDLPLLRYASDVRGRMIAGPCPCGTDGVVIDLR